MSRIIAFDQSSHTTGYAVFDNNKPVIISHFDISDSNFGIRLKKIRQKIIELINEYQPDEVIFEDIQLQDINGNREAGIKTFKMLAQVQGVIIELMEELKYKYQFIYPITWKATIKIANKGRAQEKKAAQTWVRAMYGLDCTEDEADAACIASHFIKTQNSELNWD